MLAIYLGLLGLFAFVAGVLACGIWLRRNPTRVNAEKSSRIMHFLFFSGLGAPFLVALIFPGLNNLDRLLGLPPLPFAPVCLAIGVLLALPGLYLLGASNRLLRAIGSGANAFRLTQRIVAGDVYQYSRNPMSLGYYLAALSIALLCGSSLLTLYVLLGIIPAHLFFLKFFEERELELRFGQTYQQYRQKVPFLFPRGFKNIS